MVALNATGLHPSALHGNSGGRGIRLVLSGECIDEVGGGEKWMESASLSIGPEKFTRCHKT